MINPIFYNVIIIILFKLLLLVVLSWLVYFIFTYKKPLSRDQSWYVYKINNFMNKIYIGVYISIFISSLLSYVLANFYILRFRVHLL